MKNEDKPARKKNGKTKAASNPVESKSIKSKPAQSKSAQSKPAQSKPAQTKTTESKSAKSKPAKSKPAKTKAAASGTKPKMVKENNAAAEKAESLQSRFERRKEETREQIVSTAMKLFKKSGFENVTMEQIAREADIARGTLYNHFPVKEAILSQFIKSSFGEKNPQRIAQIKKLSDTRSRMVTVIGRLMEGVESEKEIFEKYLVYRVQSILSLFKPGEEKSGIEELTGEIISLGRQNNEIRSDIPSDILLDLFEFTFIEVVKRFFMNPDGFKKKKTIEMCVDLFLNGVSQPADLKVKPSGRKK